MKLRLRTLPLLVGPLLAGLPTATAAQHDVSIPAVGELGGPGRQLTTVELEQWLRGRALFDQPMHRSRGLGAPGMNADSCRGCHQDPVIGGAGGLELNVSRFGKDDGSGGSFANLPGGQGLSKLYPPWRPGREEAHANANVFEQRQTPPSFGLGLLDTILPAAILQNEDPTDQDGDGVFGVARQVDVGGGVFEIGRFGWKAQVPRLADFVRDAMGGELGMTTPDDGRPFAMLVDNDTVLDPELSEAEVQDIAFFLEELGPPLRQNPLNPGVRAGEEVFQRLGCAKCHVPSLMGTNGPVPLYSNLLLHDVMPAGFRGMSEPGAGVGMFKTPPLWGIRHSAPYMHDGRAETLDGAIRAHFSEGDTARTSYEALAPEAQQLLLDFLNDL